MNKTDSKKILLVFEDRRETATMSQILLLNKYHVLHAKDKNEAMTIAKKAKPDLIILDSQSKKIDGAEFLRSMKSAPQTRRIPFLIVTESRDQDQGGAGDRDSAHSLLKPFTREQLAIAVQKSLKSS